MKCDCLGTMKRNKAKLKYITKELLSLMATWRQNSQRIGRRVLSQKGRKKYLKKKGISLQCYKKGQTRRGFTMCHVKSDLTRAV